MLADTKGVLLDERIVAATFHTWFKSGFVAVSAYLHVNEEMGQKNMALFTTLAQYLLRVRALGYEWIVAADYSMDRALLQPRATSIGGVL
eukprot:4387595-Pyramimonas_sp.AAC.1